MTSLAKKDFLDDEILELAINAGAKDCITSEKYHEIICKKDDFYKVKTSIEKKVNNILFSGIEWRANENINLGSEKTESIKKIVELLEDEDDVQKVFLNSKIDL